jgi:hypothetical protein
MPVDTIVVICLSVAMFAAFLGTLAYGQWMTRHLD